MGENDTRRFGRYRLIRRLAQGGMAEIWIAREDSQPDQDVVVKRIHPHLATDEQFVMMFLDEARIAARLDHPGCVQIFDLGRQKDAYYLAMEYIHGEDVRSIARQARKKALPLPRKLAIAIVAGAAEGLHYAHDLKDAASGKPLNVVHRDVSPQNILVTYDGFVKIVDFGIAKAADQANKTQAGVLKGKYAYMSPEQVRGLPLDRRSDVFSLGILLYELTTGKRLFKAATELETMRRITSATIVPPTKVSPGYPAKLETIISKALAPDRDERYESADALMRDLLQFLAEHRSSVSTDEISSFMRRIFADRLQAEQAAQARGDQDAFLKARFGEENDVEESGSGSKKSDPNRDDNLDMDIAVDVEEQPRPTPPPKASSRKSVSSPRPSVQDAPPASRQAAATTKQPLVPPSAADMDTDNVGRPNPLRAQKGPLPQAPLPRDRVDSIASQDSPRGSAERARRTAEQPESIRADTASPDYRERDLPENADYWRATTDITDHPLTPKRRWRKSVWLPAAVAFIAGSTAVLFFTDWGQGLSRAFSEERDIQVGFDPERHLGHETPESTHTKVDEETISEDMLPGEEDDPIDETGSVPSHDLDTDIDPARVSVDEPGPEEEAPIEDERPAKKVASAEPAPAPRRPAPRRRPPQPRVGYVTITADAPGVAFLDGNEIGQLPLQRHSLSPGTHTFVLKGEDVEQRVRVQLRAGQTVNRSISLRTGLLRIRVVPWAEIHLGNRHLGTTPLAPVRVPAGNHTLVAHNPEMDVRREVPFKMEPDGELLLTIDLANE